MAYSGTTAASSVSNPPRGLVSRFADSGLNSTTLSTAIPASGGASPYRTQGGGLWVYSSSHPSSTVLADNFFTDAKPLGMHPGDVLFIQKWTTAGSSVTLTLATVVSVSTAGALMSTSQYISST
jgi:hypothetical protein